VSRLRRIVEGGVYPALDDLTVKFLIGRKYLAAQEQLRRVIWVPVESTIDKPEKMGGFRTTEAAEADVKVSSSAMIREENVEIYIFGEDEDKTEALFDAMLSAIHRTVGGNSTRPTTYRWVDEDEGVFGFQLRQPCIVVRIGIRMPVPLEVKDVCVITAATHTCEYVAFPIP